MHNLSTTKIFITFLVFFAQLAVASEMGVSPLSCKDLDNKWFNFKADLVRSFQDNQEAQQEPGMKIFGNKNRGYSDFELDNDNFDEFGEESGIQLNEKLSFNPSDDGLCCEKNINLVCKNQVSVSVGPKKKRVPVLLKVHKISKMKSASKNIGMRKKCSECRETFVGYRGLMQHRLQKHLEPGKKVSYCGVGSCSYVASEPSNVRRHKYAHHGVYSYFCLASFCKAGFVKQNERDAHQLVCKKFAKEAKNE